MMGKKTDNHNINAKLELRRYFLRKYHADQPPSVFDCCQGSGKLWGILRNEYQVASYWGVDVKPKKGRLKVDSSRMLQAGVRADVVDIDTYGYPWKHWNAINSDLRSPVTVFLTFGLTNIGSSVEKCAAEAIGVSGLKLPSTIWSNIANMSASYCLTKHCEFSTIIEAVESLSDGNARYFGIRVEPKQNEPIASTIGSEHQQAIKEPAHVR